ncbi:hypothetical protein H072_2925 [Dactylellina haptotyla CBS 200.50]|uniref:Mid2 domain-containing protein n=1 Tax=Dactylellina haptotyla (strain CBS 200.50) TaxID=1284197 RepID=S8AJF1_DACHA|nr:hypothetical protein H072_2925 [Dactylellina haptotyla CBS 200.50]
MKQTTAAGTLLPSTFSLLIFLATSTQAYVVPTLAPAAAFTHTFDQPVALAQQQTSRTKQWPTDTILTTTVSGKPTEFTFYSCPLDTSQSYTVYTFTASSSGTLSAVTKTAGACPMYEEVVKTGLSTGAIAGIAIGVSIPIFAGVAFFFYRMMKKRREEEANTPVPVDFDGTSSIADLNVNFRRHQHKSTGSTVTTAAEIASIRGGLIDGKEQRRPRHGVVTNITAGKR